MAYDAIATLIISETPQPGVLSTQAPAVTFFTTVPDQKGTIFYNGPAQSEKDAKWPLTPNQWQPAFRHYKWTSAGNVNAIMWNTEASDVLANQVPITYSNQQSQTPSAPQNAEAPSNPLVTSAPSTAASNVSHSGIAITTSASAPGPSTAKPGSGGLSGGAVAGVAIGCAVAGALIAGLLMWFCLGKSKKRRTGPDRESSAMALMHNREKGPTAKALSLESGSPIALAAETGLPQPLEDKAISGEVSKISNLIKNHVQSFYHNGRVSPGLLDLDDLQGLGNDLPISTGTLSTLLGNADTREIALRFCIAWIVVSRMQLSSGPDRTFLPLEIAQCFQSMAFVDRASRAQTIFLAKWRAIGAELMQTTYVRNAFSPSDPRNVNIDAALRALDGILLPYCDSRMDQAQRRRNLEEMLKRAASFAFTLFSQPSSWDFDWQDHQGVMSGSLCVFPALVQVTDETGASIKPPRAFSEAVVRRLDG